MRILKTACGNINEAFIEDRFTDGVNIIFSNDNNKGKTIIFQGMMYALGNDPIFPSGFDYKSYYFYTSIEVNGDIYEFLRHNNSFAIKFGDRVSVFDDQSSLKYHINSSVFALPTIEKDGLQKLVDLPLLYELFFVGQDKRNPSNVINTGYYNKQDFANMIYSLAGCLTLNDSIEKLRRLREALHECKAEIDTLSRRLTFYREHPEIASVVSQNADRENIERERKEYHALNDAISALQKKRDRLMNRRIRLENLLSELNSLNMQLKCGEIRCQECGSSNITYTNKDLSFELTNDLVRKNIMQSIRDSIEMFDAQIRELQQQIVQKQDELAGRLNRNPPELSNILIYTETIRTCSEDEERLRLLYAQKDQLEIDIELERKKQEANTQEQNRIKDSILSKMNAFYKLIDPDGMQDYQDFFATRNMTFSGSEEQEYYFSRTLAMFWILQHHFPIVMDCFRKGELSTKKENMMIEEYKKTGAQVIISSTLKDEEYQSGTKYYSIDGVQALNYETNPNSHILQPSYTDDFMTLVQSFGVVI